MYGDLREAIAYLKEQTWIPLITAEPPALTKDISRGYELSPDDIGLGISYDDLARGMVQMAEEEGGQRWVGKGVGIKATGTHILELLFPILYQFLSRKSQSGSKTLLLLPRLVSFTQLSCLQYSMLTSRCA